MRITGLSGLRAGNDIHALQLTPKSFERLLDAIGSGFATDEGGSWVYHPEYSIGAVDAFFAANGHFNLFNPCNQWTGRVLSQAGVKTGRWTPTSYSLLWSLKWNNSD